MKGVTVVVAVSNNPLTLNVNDFSGQNPYVARAVPPDSTIGEVIRSLLSQMGLIDKVDGRPLPYGLRLDREGRQLNASERVSDVLREADELTLTPSITAG